MTLPYSRLQEINSYQKFLLAFKAATQCNLFFSLCLYSFLFDQKSIIHWQDPRKFFVQPKFWRNFETALFKYIHSRVCRKLLTSPAKSSPLDLFPSCQWKDTTWFPRRTFHLYHYDLSLPGLSEPGDGTQRAKFAQKVHKPPLGVNIINFELNGFKAVPQTPKSYIDRNIQIHRYVERNKMHFSTYSSISAEITPFRLVWLFWCLLKLWVPKWNAEDMYKIQNLA